MVLPVAISSYGVYCISPSYWLFCIFPRVLLADCSPSYFYWDQVRIKLERISFADADHLVHAIYLYDLIPIGCHAALPVFLLAGQSSLSSFPIGCFCVFSAGSGADQNGAQYPGWCEPSFPCQTSICFPGAFLRRINKMHFHFLSLYRYLKVLLYGPIGARKSMIN